MDTNGPNRYSGPAQEDRQGDLPEVKTRDITTSLAYKQVNTAQEDLKHKTRAITISLAYKQAGAKKR